MTTNSNIVSFTAIITDVTQRFSLVGEKRCVTTLKMAAKETNSNMQS